MLFPGVTGCFGSCNRYPRPGDPTEADQTPTPLQPEPSGSFFCCLHVVAYGSSSVSTYYAQRAIGLAQGVTGKSPAAHLYWYTPGPSVPPTILHQFLVFLPLSLLGLLHPFLPGHCQLQQDLLFCGLRDQDDVRSQFGLGDVCWNFQLPFQVDCHCPVPGLWRANLQSSFFMLSLAFVLPW